MELPLLTIYLLQTSWGTAEVQLLLKEPWECAAGKERGKSQKLEIQGDTRASFRKGLKKGGCHLNLLWRWGVILLKSPCRQPAGALGFCLALNKTEGGQRKRREWRKERSSHFIHFFFCVCIPDLSVFHLTLLFMFAKEVLLGGSGQSHSASLSIFIALNRERRSCCWETVHWNSRWCCRLGVSYKAEFCSALDCTMSGSNQSY